MQQHGHMSAHGLPQLSANAEYLTIRDCFELGHVGKVLLGEKSSVHVSMAQYQYFVWLDSSAKGPLLPTHTLQGDHASAWHTLPDLPHYCYDQVGGCQHRLRAHQRGKAALRLHHTF